ncbi:MAG: hypothetical protein Satyrvirus2_49 [Satyrvirus sp.]|uniref:Uncharacterized protein n=1 Tax=Satyrvirus sp. TaxID=2487771 RepID=A0A3G5ACT2_9VIRU|nr:MAG: hypothetical protein Satyrvirus2_49 [Satyrvirus sp.]
MITNFDGVVSDTYGYNPISDMYENIYNTISQHSPYYSLQVKPQIDYDIKKKIEELRTTEKKLVQQLDNLDIRRQLQMASRGYIDAYRIPEKNLPAILMKHSNLLNEIEKYNTQVVDLSNFLQPINNILVSQAQMPGTVYVEFV